MQKYKLGSLFKLEREKSKEMEYRQGNRNIKKKTERERERKFFGKSEACLKKRAFFESIEEEVLWRILRAPQT
jgi:hypothetical protein